MQRVVIVIAALVALLVVVAPARILWGAWSAQGGSPPDGLLMLNTKDSTRVADAEAGALSVRLAQSVFPEGNDAPAGLTSGHAYGKHCSDIIRRDRIAEAK